MTKKIRPLALNLRSVLQYNGMAGITKEDILPQDMSFQDEKLKRLNKMMKKHPGRNRDWDPEIKHVNLAVVEDIKLDPTLRVRFVVSLSAWKQKLTTATLFVLPKDIRRLSIKNV